MQALIVAFRVLTLCNLVGSYQRYHNTSKMDEVGSSQVFVTTYNTAWRDNHEGHIQNICLRDNHIFHKFRVGLLV